MVQKASGCPQNEIFSTLNRARYFRWRNANLVYLYDSSSEQIMTVRKIRDRVVEDSTAANAGQPQTNPTVSQVPISNQVPSTSTEVNNNNSNKSTSSGPENVVVQPQVTPVVKLTTPVITP